MARIIITLTPYDIGNILSGGEVGITPSVQKFDNLTEVVIKCHHHDVFPELEVEKDD